MRLDAQAQSWRGAAVLWMVCSSSFALAQPPCDADGLFAQGRDEYERSDYARAAETLLRAYECHPDPALLFNAARAYDRARNVDAAIATYQRYLESSPTSEAASRARAAIAALRDERASAGVREPPEPERGETLDEPDAFGGASPAPEAVASDAEDDVFVAPPSASRPTATVWVSAAITGLTAATGVTFRVLASREARRAEDAPTHERGVPLAQRARRLDRTALGLALVSGVSLVVTVVAGVRRRRTLDVALGPTSLAVRGTF